MFVVLDTNHFSELVHDTARSARLRQRFSERGAEVLTTIVTAQCQFGCSYCSRRLARPQSGISAKDVFFTWYANGVSPEEDKPLFASESRFTTSLELRIDSGNVADFRVNGLSCLKRVIPAEIRRRVGMLAWGDRNPYAVEARNLSVTTAARLFMN